MASVNAGYSVFTQLNGTTFLNYNGFSVGGSTGIAYFFNPHISIETCLVYNDPQVIKPSFLPHGQGFLGFYVFLDKKNRNKRYLAPQFNHDDKSIKP